MSIKRKGKNAMNPISLILQIQNIQLKLAQIYWLTTFGMCMNPVIALFYTIKKEK